MQKHQKSNFGLLAFLNREMYAFKKFIELKMNNWRIKAGVFVIMKQANVVQPATAQGPRAAKTWCVDT